MTRGFLVSAIAAVSALSTSCHVLGLQADACEVGDDSTCPSGQFCTTVNVHQGLSVVPSPICAKGSNPATTPVDVVTNETGAGPIVVDAKTGDVFFATGAAPGCIRELKAGATKAVDFACEATDKIGAFTLDDKEVFWTVDAGANGLARAQSRAAGAQPQTLANTMTVTPQSAGFASINVAHHADGTESIMWSRRDADSDATRVLRTPTGPLIYQIDYSDLLPDTIDEDSAVLVLADETAAFTGARFDDGTITFAYRADIKNHDEGGGSGQGYDGTVDFSAVHKPLGTIDALVALDANASSIAIGTVAGDGGGALIKMGTNTFAPKLLAAQADPDSPLTHASALATDGFNVYYATAGTPSPGKKRGLFKIDLFATNAKPVRITDVDVDGGGVAFDAVKSRLLWAEPKKNRIRSVVVVQPQQLE